MAMLYRIAWPILRVWWMVRRPRTLGVRALVLDPAGRVALIRHSYRPGWFLPGGAVDRNEPMRVAVQREVHEEAGLSPINVERVIGIYHTRAEGKDDHVALFLAHAADGVWQTIRPADPREIAEAAWFSFDDLPADTTPSTRRRIEAYASGAVESDQW